MNQDVDDKGKMKGTKPLALAIIAIIFISFVTSTFLYVNYTETRPFFVSGLDASDSNITFELSLSHKPKLDKETTIHWKSSYEDTSAPYLAPNPEMLQLILPDEIQLVEGVDRIVINQGDSIDFTWTIEPNQIGEFYLKFGLCSYANESLMQNVSLNYYEVSAGHGLYYATYLLGLHVDENTGYIIEPERAMNASYEFSGYKSTQNYTGPDPSFIFDIGDIVWLNVTVDSICDIPMVDSTLFLTSDNVFIMNCLEPIDCSFVSVLNFSKGSNVVNFKFKMIDNMPSELRNFRITLRTQGTLAVIGEDRRYPVDQCLLYMTLWTSPSLSSTRSMSHNDYPNDINIDENNNMASFILSWHSYESLNRTNYFGADIISG